MEIVHVDAIGNFLKYFLDFSLDRLFSFLFFLENQSFLVDFWRGFLVSFFGVGDAKELVSFLVARRLNNVVLKCRLVASDSRSLPTEKSG